VFYRLKENEACVATQDTLNKIQPHQQFLLFLDNTGFDDTLIVDLLVSPETCFLSYFTQYLRVVFSEWTEFVNTHSQYKPDISVIKRNDSKEGLNTEWELNSDDEMTSASVNEVPSGSESNMSNGLALLQQYDDAEKEEVDEDDDEAEDNIEVEKEEVEEDHHDDVIQDGSTKSDFDSRDSELKQDGIDRSKSCDLPPAGVDSCLDQTMAVLIRVRLKMEKYKDSSVIQYNPAVLIHLIEKVEELYEQ
jgi:hypothetical protein